MLSFGTSAYMLLLLITMKTQNVEEQFQTTSQDLAGFWDLVMIQVDDVRLMFAEIEQLRQNAWKELSSPEVGRHIVFRPTHPFLKRGCL